VDQRELVERAGGGDHDAFAVLVDASITRLGTVARLILRDQELARDAVQEAYIRAWRELPRLRDPQKFDAWLHRLTVNACLDAVRRRRRRPIEVEISPILSPTIADHSGHVADQDVLARGFRRIGVDHRAVLVLHYYVGLSASAVAETLDIPVGTAQSRLHRALAELRAAIAADERLPAEPRTVIA
jgi:RNA polymerase sigma-70 factor (ECF subfamily)